MKVPTTLDKNEQYHIYMNAMSVIFGCQELQVTNNTIRHIKHLDNLYDEVTMEHPDQWDGALFPPSFCLVPSKSSLIQGKT